MYKDTVAIYDAWIARNPDIERKGKTMPYTSANTYMFTLVNKDGEIGVRLSKASGKAFSEKHQADIFKSHGAIMKDYVKIPVSLYSDTKLMDALLEEGIEHVLSLPAQKGKK